MCIVFGREIPKVKVKVTPNMKNLSTPTAPPPFNIKSSIVVHIVRNKTPNTYAHKTDPLFFNLPVFDKVKYDPKIQTANR